MWLDEDDGLRLSTPEEKWEWIVKRTGISKDEYLDALGDNMHSSWRSLNVGDVDTKQDRFVLYHHQSHEIQYIIYPEKHELWLDRVDMQGVGKEVFSKIIEFGKRTGLYDHVVVDAGKQQGPYAWLRYGFLPDQEQWDSMRTTAHRLLSNLKYIHEEGVSADVVASRIEAILAKSDPKAARELAQMPGEIVFKRGMKDKAAHIMLRGDAARYRATFDLNDQASLNTFEEYKLAAETQRLR